MLICKDQVPAAHPRAGGRRAVHAWALHHQLCIQEPGHHALQVLFLKLWIGALHHAADLLPVGLIGLRLVLLRPLLLAADRAVARRS